MPTTSTSTSFFKKKLQNVADPVTLVCIGEHSLLQSFCIKIKKVTTILYHYPTTQTLTATLFEIDVQSASSFSVHIFVMTFAVLFFHSYCRKNQLMDNSSVNVKANYSKWQRCFSSPVLLDSPLHHPFCA